MTYYASTAARDVANPSPANGDICYIAATSAAASSRAMQVRTAAGWLNFYPAPVAARKTANETVTSTTTVQNDDDLILAVEANTTYAVMGIFYLSGNDTADFKFNFTFPASAKLSGGMISLLDSTAPGASTGGDGNFRAVTDESTPSTALGMGISDTNFVMGIYHGLLTVSSTAGNLTLQWAQGVSDPTGTVLRLGSHVVAQRIL